MKKFKAEYIVSFYINTEEFEAESMEEAMQMVADGIDISEDKDKWEYRDADPHKVWEVDNEEEEQFL